MLVRFAGRGVAKEPNSTPGLRDQSSGFERNLSLLTIAKGRVNDPVEQTAIARRKLRFGIKAKQKGPFQPPQEKLGQHSLVGEAANVVQQVRLRSANTLRPRIHGVVLAASACRCGTAPPSPARSVPLGRRGVGCPLTR